MTERSLWLVLYTCSHGEALRISACASRAACATAPSPKLDTVEPPCHVLQEGRTLEGCQRRRELAQQRHLMVSEAKCLHVRGSDMNGRSFPRAIARSRRSRKRMSIFSSCSRDHRRRVRRPAATAHRVH